MAPPRKSTLEPLRLPALRLVQAFHDFATHNVTDGTGGLDASIIYELDRAQVSPILDAFSSSWNDRQ